MEEQGAQPEGFETVDHTADAGLRVRARSLEGLFRHAAEGLGWLLAGGQAIERRESRDFTLSGLDLEELLVDWLNEILYVYETDRLLLGWFEIQALHRLPAEGAGGGPEGYELRARAEGERRDPRRHAGGVEIKAATYHDLRIAEQAGAHDVTLIFDT